MDSTWVLLGLHAHERKKEYKSSKEIDEERNIVSREEAEQLAKDMGRWTKKNFPYVECDARDKAGFKQLWKR